MSSKLSLSILAIVVVSFSFIVVGHVGAPVSELNLPSTSVTIEVYNGTKSYFYVLVSNVTEASDVVERTYRAWCIDERTFMSRSPATHQVLLFSTYTSPMVLPNERWDMVNYVLNHKQGSGRDIQQAIWHFVDLAGNYSVWSAKALAMVDDAEANGTGFVPGSDQVVAVICYPLEPGIQMTIMEMPPQTLIADLNCDGIVNIVDVTMVATAFGSKPGSPSWANIADVNHDGVVNIVDVTLITLDFGKTSP